jgi:hypothetical protein
MTVEELQKLLLGFTSRLNSANQKLLLLGAKDLEGRMKLRIFSDGKDANETSIGDYKSKSWIKKRKETGRQTAKVDLEYTGQLRNSIQVVQDSNETVIAIINNEDYLKAKGQEQRRNKVIFEPSREEEIDVQNYINDLIQEEIDKIISSL